MVLTFPAAGLCQTATKTFEWNPNSESDLAGYKLYRGTAPGNYTDVVNVGNVTRYSWQGFQTGAEYYVNIKAFDTSANESPYDGEVKVDLLPPTKVQGFKPVAD